MEKYISLILQRERENTERVIAEVGEFEARGARLGSSDERQHDKMLLSKLSERPRYTGLGSAPFRAAGTDSARRWLPEQLL